jgi:hypothetical protein
LNFKNYLVETLNPTKKYFICSNSSFVKKVFSETNLDIKMYRDWIGADHVLRDQTHYLFCETIQEAEEVVSES